MEITDTILWKSGNKEIAEVYDGTVIACGSGTAKITAYTESGISKTCIIIVGKSGSETKVETIQEIPEGIDSEVVEDIFNTTTKIVSIKNTKGKVMQLRLDSFDKFDGYEVQYSTKKSMESSKKVTSKTRKLNIKKLKKKKYYVRARVYGKLSGKKYYGSWSVIKTIKIKK